MARPNELTLGLLTLLAGFGQGYAQGKVNKQEQQREDVARGEIRRERELTREETRQARMSEEGARIQDRAQRSEEFAINKGLQERGIAVQEEGNRQRAAESVREATLKGRELDLRSAGLDLERDALNARTQVERLMLQVEQARTKAANAGQPTSEQDFVLASLAELNKNPLEAISIFSRPDKLAPYMQGLRTSFRIATAAGVTPQTPEMETAGSTPIGPMPGIYSPFLGREVPNTQQLMQNPVDQKAVALANERTYYERILTDVLSRRTGAPLDSILAESLNKPRPKRNAAYASPTKTVK